ncbi:MAG: zf-TFIIB domain-containing protein [Acidobacteria bacterium]|nr:zf-TFIIB domain-containing protein [Acidobacteriota bacterium]
MCPVCRIPLVGFELEGIELDRCIDCRGVWLDPGELEAIGEAAGVSPGGLTAALRAAVGKKHRERKCPRCERRLKTVRIGPRESIEIERCPRGDGLWFDHGEMEMLIASFDTGEEGAVARFLAGLTGYHAEPIES